MPSPLLSLQHDNAVYCAAFSPNGRQLATGSLDESIKLWELPSGKNLARLDGHGDAVCGLAWLGDGSLLRLTDPQVARELRNRLRDAACARFSTVLGPGSDGYHESHVHLDLAERRSGHRMCQWDVREPGEPAAAEPVPLPRARPTTAHR